MKKLAEKALQQIYYRNYDVQMKEYDIQKILRYGMAFCGKRVEFLKADKSLGYVDFIFYPKLDMGAECMIPELKVDHSAEEVVQQSKERQYALRFAPKMGRVQFIQENFDRRDCL